MMILFKLQGFCIDQYFLLKLLKFNAYNYFSLKIIVYS
jgi:hypothetical protein